MSAITKLSYTSPVRTQADLAAALLVGGTIEVDSSTTITLTAQLNVTQPTRITGGKFSVASGPAFYVTSSDVTIAGVTITGGGTSSYDSNQKLIYVKGTSSVPLSNICIRNCTLQSSRSDNVWLEWCSDSLVTANLIYTYLYSGVMVISGVRVSVTDNVIRDAPLSVGVVNNYGIAFTDLDNTSAARSRDCQAVGNMISYIDWEAIDTHGGSGISIVGNTIVACPRGIALVVGNASRLTAPTRCTVSGNSINGTGQRQVVREGIFLGGIAGVSADGTVSGNTVTNMSPTFSLDFVDRAKTTFVGNNEYLVPWTNITLDGDYNANATYPPQYAVEGNTVMLRGAAIPKGSSTRTVIGHLPSAFAWPSTVTMVGYVKGSNAAAGNGMIGVDTDGTVSLYYFSGTDVFSYFLSGTYQAV
jgi:Right handed beta helix region